VVSMPFLFVIKTNSSGSPFGNFLISFNKISGIIFVFITNKKGIETTETNKRNYFSDKFGKIKKELKLGKEYTIYSFRHTYITKLYREFRKTKTELETYDLLMKVTGHSTLTALKSYLRDIDAELAADYSDYLR
jgi:integrase